MSIQNVVPTDAIKLKIEAAEIQVELEALLKQEDVKCRALYVHYLDKNTYESNVPRLFKSVEGIDLLIEINTYPVFIKTMGRIRKFLTTLMAELALRVDKSTKVSSEKLRVQIKSFRCLLNNPKCPADLRMSFNKSLDQMEKILLSSTKSSL